ncbi:MAG: hypothetical protein NC548_34640 [Lachnospiraceae bacterium]|nr:hypothetical protein [Lachnospiraceae bacterium]
MTEYELEQICQSSPDCGCDCYHCEAYAAYYRSENGLDEYDDEEEYE